MQLRRSIGVVSVTSSAVAAVMLEDGCITCLGGREGVPSSDTGAAAAGKQQRGQVMVSAWCQKRQRKRMIHGFRSARAAINNSSEPRRLPSTAVGRLPGLLEQVSERRGVFPQNFFLVKGLRDFRESTDECAGVHESLPQIFFLQTRPGRVSVSH